MKRKYLSLKILKDIARLCINWQNLAQISYSFIFLGDSIEFQEERINALEGQQIIDIEVD